MTIHKLFYSWYNTVNEDMIFNIFHSLFVVRQPTSNPTMLSFAAFTHSSAFKLCQFYNEIQIINVFLLFILSLKQDIKVKEHDKA